MPTTTPSVGADEAAQRLLEYRIGDAVPLCPSFLHGEEPADGEFAVEVAADLYILSMRTLMEVEKGLFLSGYQEPGGRVSVMMRDTTFQPRRAFRFIEALKQALGAQTFSFDASTHHTFTLYTVTYTIGLNESSSAHR